jgi:hypothetical protein
LAGQQLVIDDLIAQGLKHLEKLLQHQVWGLLISIAPHHSPPSVRLHCLPAPHWHLLGLVLAQLGLLGLLGRGGGHGGWTGG